MPFSRRFAPPLLLTHAARVLGAPGAILAWVDKEEPWLYLASWSGGAFTWVHSDPEPFSRLTAEPLRESSFLCPDTTASPATVLCRTARGLERWRGAPLDPAFEERFRIRSVLALPIRGESLEGWLFFTGKPAMTQHLPEDRRLRPAGARPLRADQGAGLRIETGRRAQRESEVPVETWM